MIRAYFLLIFMVLFSGCANQNVWVNHLEKNDQLNNIKVDQANLKSEIKSAFAVEDYNKILKITDVSKPGVPYNSVIFAIRCAAYQELGQYKEATESCDTALKIDGNNSIALNAQYLLLEKKAKPEIFIRH